MHYPSLMVDTHGVVHSLLPVSTTVYVGGEFIRVDSILVFNNIVYIPRRRADPGDLYVLTMIPAPRAGRADRTRRQMLSKP